ncbi:hypothetical protein TIFTF001_001033 [Ficus carica]|uniref:Proline-rich protein n=1 Tax=Ficus carica TaxID=3494 RepID=A0AA87ZG41_FICCA|nr:hypothetical protein TIFTF001_001033 [Ficus carica]
MGVKVAYSPLTFLVLIHIGVLLLLVSPVFSYGDENKGGHVFPSSVLRARRRRVTPPPPPPRLSPTIYSSPPPPRRSPPPPLCPQEEPPLPSEPPTSTS